MRQFGQVTPCRDHSMWTSVWCKRSRGSFERRARFQQPRAADRDDDVVEQAVGDQPRIFAGAETDADVDVVLLEIAHLARDVEAQLDAGVRLAKQIYPRHQPFRGERGVRASP